MSEVIIGIHGMGNKPPPKTLSRWWQASIREGWNRSQKSKLNLTFELVYWAHYLHSSPLKPRIKDKKHPLYIKERYFKAPSNVAAEKPGVLRRKIANYLSDQLDRIFLNDDLTINYESIVDFIVHHYFRDLEKYYSSYCVIPSQKNRPARELICSELVNVLHKHSGDKIMLIAHSMGSIIAYEALTQGAADVPVDTFVTIGSPLGLPIIKSRIAVDRDMDPLPAGMLQTPENILSHWYNLADMRDKIALDYTLKDDFQNNSRHIGPVDKFVYNDYAAEDEKNPHKSFGYLRTPEMAAIINNFLSDRL